MGLLDRLINGINRVGGAIDNADEVLWVDRRFAQADRLAAEGVRNEGVLTGIKQRFDDNGTNTIIRLTWFAPDERSAGILFSVGQTSTLRLGMTVAIRTDDDEAVLDWETMNPVWGGTQTEPGQRRTRFVPDPGLDDTAFDARVLGRWKKWTPARATVVSFARRAVLGMPVDNFDIVLRGQDGVVRTNPNELVPFYGRWLIAPGADVPVMIDPGGGDRAQLDWRRLTVERAVPGGRWQDRPPPGSIAAEVIATRPEPAQTVSFAEPADFTPPPGGLAPIEGVTLQQWAAMTAALQTAGVPPAQYNEFATANFGVPPGRWTAVDQAWLQRQQQDWKIGMAMGEAISAEQKAQKAQRKAARRK